MSLTTDELKSLGAHLAAALLPQVQEMAKAAIDAHIPTALAPLANTVVDAVAANAETAFAGNLPGVGGPAPESTGSDVVTRAEFDALAAKLDALVQATGHGNSAAMGAHL